MRKSYALGDLTKNQPEIFIKLAVKYFNSIFQAFFSW